MKGFTNVLFCVLLVVVGGWGVIGMQEGQKLYQQHQRSTADLRVISVERDNLATQVSDLEAKLADVSDGFDNAQLVIADTGKELAMANSTIGDLRLDVERKAVELESVRRAQKRLADDYKSICDTVDRLRAERDALAAQ